MNHLWTLLAVGAGGAVGSMLRWGISQIPWLSSWTIPWMTLAVNLIGAVIIGVIAGAVLGGSHMSTGQVAFLKTGFCGGLTTFSTFSLESMALFQAGHYAACGIYVLLSLALCFIGVWIGQLIARSAFA